MEGARPYRLAVYWTAVFALFLASCGTTRSTPPLESTGADITRDLIRTDDPSAHTCLIARGQAVGEFYDKSNDRLVRPDDTWFFIAQYSEGPPVEIRIHPDTTDGTPQSATQIASEIAVPIGQLPAELRVGIKRVGYLPGDTTAQADGGGEGIHLYADNVKRRQGDNRFEETLFHEAVHTSLDDRHGNSPEWTEAQQADGEFLTSYARVNVEREDLAETALYAYAILHYPDRLSNEDIELWQELVPNRIAVIDNLLSPPPAAQSSEPDC